MGSLINVQAAGGALVLLPTPYQFSNLAWMIDNEDPGRGAFSAHDGRVTVKMATPFTNPDGTDYLNCFNNLLGYSYTGIGPNNTYFLRRNPPFSHPKLPTYYCTHIEDSYGFQYGLANGTTQYQPVNPGVNAYQLQAGALYNYMIFTATFEPLKAYLAPDSAALPEYYRYIEYDYSGRAEFLTRPYGNFLAKEGTVSAGGVVPDGHCFPVDFKAVEQKADIQIMWRQVPEDWVSANGIGVPGLPQKIFNCIGSVNSGAIWGFPAGTLLMLKPDIDRYPCPLVLAQPGVNSLQTMYCDIKFKFVWHDPPLGVQVLGIGAPIQRGHNNKPFFTGYGGGNAGVTRTLYYYAAAPIVGVPTPSNVATYDAVDFTQMFTNVNA